jgi:aminoacyl-tRNA hydrolase
MAAARAKAFSSVRNALAWRLRRLVGDGLVDATFVKVAHRWRRLLRRPVCIGITGSAGKTTTKELMLGMLSAARRGSGNPGTLNALPEIAKTLLRVRPTDDFCVAELDETRPGELDEVLALLRPRVGIVTVVGSDHWSAYGSREAIAAEIGKLVAALPATGTAVLNADDGLIHAMAARSAARVITYGVSPAADLRAEEVRSVWPHRLEMTLVHGGQRVQLRTRLCGSHWIPSVLSAIGGGLAIGLSLAECAEGIAKVEPFEGRMQPVTTADGVTFIRDDFKAPLWTLDASFEFMKAAQAKRKIIVIGELSDLGSGKKGNAYDKAAGRAQRIAEITIFVGPWASSALKTRQAESEVRAFSHVRDAARYLNAITQSGDLVLLKGTNKNDHLVRIIMARSDAIACWRDDCRRFDFCTECSERTKPSGPPVQLPTGTSAETAVVATASATPAIGSDDVLIVGLGNPEASYAGTPHNVGHEVVDHLASCLGLTWSATPEAWIARGSAQGRSLCLIKLRSAMNSTGPALKQLAGTLSFTPERCILVHDDLGLAIGTVRTRLGGGAGGHRGVASVLEAFQTDAFRRIKVGVGHAPASLDRVEYVLTRFAPANRTAIDQAIRAAGERTLALVGQRSKGP